MFRLDTPGGGGYGDPLSRPAEHVLADVREGHLSAEAAERDYGVVLTEDGEAVDAEATDSRRVKLREGGPPVPRVLHSPPHETASASKCVSYYLLQKTPMSPSSSQSGILT